MDNPTVTPIPAVPPTPTVSPQKSILSLLLTILLLLALAATGVLAYQNWQLQQQIAALQAQPAPTPTLTPTPTVDPTANWKVITRKNWSFRVPNIWSYLECNDELLFVGPSISKDQTSECGFDLSPGIIEVVRATGDSDRSIPTNTDLAFDPYVSEKSEPILDGRKAIKQQETIKDGQGAGTRIYVYVNQPDYMDIIILHDTTQKEVFDQILSTFKFIDNNNEGTLEATVIRSPTCAEPVTDQKSCEAPATNEAFKILRSPDNEVVQTVTTDQGGKLTVSLTAGAYQLQSTTSGIGKNIRNPDFTITGGKTTSQRFDVDTGIR